MQISIGVIGIGAGKQPAQAREGASAAILPSAHLCRSHRPIAYSTIVRRLAEGPPRGLKSLAGLQPAGRELALAPVTITRGQGLAHLDVDDLLAAIDLGMDIDGTA